MRHQLQRARQAAWATGKVGVSQAVYLAVNVLLQLQRHYHDVLRNEKQYVIQIMQKLDGFYDRKDSHLNGTCGLHRQQTCAQGCAVCLHFLVGQHPVGAVFQSIERSLGFGAEPAVVIGIGLCGFMGGFEGSAAVRAGHLLQRGCLRVVTITASPLRV